MKWYLPEYGETADSAIALDDRSDHGHSDTTAEIVADLFHSNHDGWEASWPVVIALVDNVAETRWTVDRESVPHFIATRTERPARKGTPNG